LLWRSAAGKPGWSSVAGWSWVRLIWRPGRVEASWLGGCQVVRLSAWGTVCSRGLAVARSTAVCLDGWLVVRLSVSQVACDEAFYLDVG